MPKDARVIESPQTPNPKHTHCAILYYGYTTKTSQSGLFHFLLVEKVCVNVLLHLQCFHIMDPTQ